MIYMDSVNLLRWENDSIRVLHLSFTWTFAEYIHILWDNKLGIYSKWCLKALQCLYISILQQYCAFSTTCNTFLWNSSTVIHFIQINTITPYEKLHFNSTVMCLDWLLLDGTDNIERNKIRVANQNGYCPLPL